MDLDYRLVYQERIVDYEAAGTQNHVEKSLRPGRHKAIHPQCGGVCEIVPSSVLRVRGKSTPVKWCANHVGDHVQRGSDIPGEAGGPDIGTEGPCTPQKRTLKEIQSQYGLVFQNFNRSPYLL